MRRKVQLMDILICIWTLLAVVFMGILIGGVVWFIVNYAR